MPAFSLPCIYFFTYPMPLGKITLECHDTAILALRFGEISPGDSRNGSPVHRETPLLQYARIQLEEYFLGNRTVFSVPLDPRGTPFQKKIWEALLQIPYGETRSYRDVAAGIGKPRAARAAGQAIHRNPLPIFIPCHRVIGADGSLGGFAPGLPLKERLLALEAQGGLTPERQETLLSDLSRSLGKKRLFGQKAHYNPAVLIKVK